MCVLLCSRGGAGVGGMLADPNAEFTPSFFSEQLTAFQLWLAHGSADQRPPEQLPIVLQVCGISELVFPGGGEAVG
jgi:hypothetical protein